MTTETKNNKRAAKLWGRCAECRIPMTPGINATGGPFYSSDGCDQKICNWCHFHRIDSEIFMKSPYLR